EYLSVPLCRGRRAAAVLRPLVCPGQRDPISAVAISGHALSMRAIVRYLTHPQVQIDRAVPIPSWGLSAVGRARVEVLIAAGWLKGTTQVISSVEQKAVETAEPIAAALGVSLEIRRGMHENDRSATGYLPATEFENVANEFFAHPHRSIRGWERAIDAQ